MVAKVARERLSIPASSAAAPLSRHHPSYKRDVWDAAHKLAMTTESEPTRIAILTRRLYDVALELAVESF
jgi:hypothetical protein